MDTESKGSQWECERLVAVEVVTVEDLRIMSYSGPDET